MRLDIDSDVADCKWILAALAIIASISAPPLRSREMSDMTTVQARQANANDLVSRDIPTLPVMEPLQKIFTQDISQITTGESMGTDVSTMFAVAQFRFMDIPLEIRRLIYREYCYAH